MAEAEAMRKLWYRMLSYLAGVVPGREPEALRAGRTLRGYGRVNWWAAAGKAALRRDLVACAAAGVEIYTIEMAGWAESSVLRNEDRLREASAVEPDSAAQATAQNRNPTDSQASSQRKAGSEAPRSRR